MMLFSHVRLGEYSSLMLDCARHYFCKDVKEFSIFYKSIHSGLSHVDENQEIFDALKQCQTLHKNFKKKTSLKNGFCFHTLPYVIPVHCFFCNPIPPACLPSLGVDPGVLLLHGSMSLNVFYFLLKCASPCPEDDSL